MPGETQVFFRNRLIAFFDILGFSDRLRTMPSSDLHALYAGLIDDAQATVFGGQDLASADGQATRNFERAQFLFDSMILVSHPLDHGAAPKSVFSFIAACISLMEKSFALDLPLRGCIGYGDFLEDPSRNIFLSPVFPDIVAAEKVQEWSGCFLLQEAVAQVLTRFYGTREDVQDKYPTKRGHALVRYPLPLKPEGTSSRWCLNWVYFTDDDLLVKGLAFLRGRKRDETAAFVQYIGTLPDDATPLPETFRPATEVRLQLGLGGIRMKYCDP